MKKFIKLIPALAMLLIATMLVSTATFAWFSMNSSVTVTGMQIRTTVNDNLLIAPDTLGSTAKAAETDFKNSLVQQYDELVEPVSTVNGKAFFYTSGTNVQGNGDALNDIYSAYNAVEVPTGEELTAFNNAYATTNAVGYVDYVFQLKAINGATASQIRLTDLTLTYGGASVTNNNKAYRVAMFYEDLGYMTPAAPTANLHAPAGGSGTLLAIFTPASAANFTNGEAVNSTSTTGSVTYCSANTTAVLPVAANVTQYYKVVVRLWLEGEDDTCNNTTFMNLKDKWSLDLKYELKAATATADAVVNIAQAYTATKTELVVGTNDGADAGALTINGVTYYPIAGKQVGGENLYVSTSKTLATTSHIFTIADGVHPIEVTNQVSITES